MSSEFRDSKDLEVAIYAGAGRAFCASEDTKESVEHGTVGRPASTREDPYRNG